MNPTDTPPLSFQPRKSPVRRRPAVEAPPTPPPPPAGPARVLSATIGPDGANVTLVFDRPLTLVGPIPYEMDGSVLIGEAAGVIVAGVTPGPATALTFDLEGTAEPGMAWSILAQPTWLATSVEVPQSGDL